MAGEQHAEQGNASAASVFRSMADRHAVEFGLPCHRRRPGGSQGTPPDDPKYNDVKKE
jgi:hypothetical protein